MAGRGIDWKSQPLLTDALKGRWPATRSGASPDWLLLDQVIAGSCKTMAGRMPKMVVEESFDDMDNSYLAIHHVHHGADEHGEGSAARLRPVSEFTYGLSRWTSTRMSR